MSTTTTPGFGHRSQPKGRERAEAVAYHEAAHAIAACALGFRDVWVSVDSNTENYSEGRYRAPACHYEAPKSWSTEKRCIRDVVTTYSGHMAEMIQYGHSVVNGASQDAADAQAMLARLPEKRRAEVSDQAISRARQLLERRWADVEWLAEMLQQHPILGVEYVNDEPVVSLARDEPVPAERTERNRQRLQERMK